MNHIRLLRADEIECRTGIIRENGLSLLLYKDARVDQNILDETFGIYGWKREHQILDGKMFCTISVKDENGEWIPKQDVGTESYSEATKGAASDSFKRAAFNIGIGRELYTAPFIWIPGSVVRLEMQNNKWITKDRFYVSNIDYYDNNRAISSLRIRNQDRIVVYEIGMGADPAAGKTAIKTPGSSNKNRAGNRNPGRKGGKKDTITQDQIDELRKELARTGVAEFHVLQRYGKATLESMDEATYLRAMKGLQKTPTAA